MSRVLISSQLGKKWILSKSDFRVRVFQVFHEILKLRMAVRALDTYHTEEKVSQY